MGVKTGQSALIDDWPHLPPSSCILAGHPSAQVPDPQVTTSPAPYVGSTHRWAVLLYRRKDIYIYAGRVDAIPCHSLLYTYTHCSTPCPCPPTPTPPSIALFPAPSPPSRRLEGRASGAGFRGGLEELRVATNCHPCLSPLNPYKAMLTPPTRTFSGTIPGEAQETLYY